MARSFEPSSRALKAHRIQGKIPRGLDESCSILDDDDCLSLSGLLIADFGLAPIIRSPASVREADLLPSDATTTKASDVKHVNKVSGLYLKEKALDFIGCVRVSTLLLKCKCISLTLAVSTFPRALLPYQFVSDLSRAEQCKEAQEAEIKIHGVNAHLFDALHVN